MEIKQLPKKDFVKIRTLVGKFYIDQARKFDKLLKINKKAIDASYKIRKKLFNKTKGTLFVAIEDSKIVGYVFGTIEKPKPAAQFKVNKIGHFWDVFVEEKYRDKGIGSALIKALLNWFKEKNVPYVRIGAYHSNKSIELYKRLGFKIRHIALQMRMMK